MLQNTARARGVLGGIAGVTLALAIGVGAGAVPRPGDTGAAKTVAASAQIEPVSATATARQPGDTAAPATVPSTAAPAATVAPATAPPTTAAKAATVTTKAPAKSTAATTATTVAAATAAATATPAAPVAVPRRVPSAAEVQQAITTLPQYIHTILTPTPAQVAQLGDQVCTAFDQGQTFAQVKATGLSMVTKLPLTTVLPGGADWVVKTTVTLYCPGHLSKLV